MSNLKKSRFHTIYDMARYYLENHRIYELKDSLNATRAKPAFAKSIKFPDNRVTFLYVLLDQAGFELPDKPEPKGIMDKIDAWIALLSAFAVTKVRHPIYYGTIVAVNEGTELDTLQVGVMGTANPTDTLFELLSYSTYYGVVRRWYSPSFITHILEPCIRS